MSGLKQESSKADRYISNAVDEVKSVFFKKKKSWRCTILSFHFQFFLFQNYVLTLPKNSLKVQNKTHRIRMLRMIHFEIRTFF